MAKASFDEFDGAAGLEAPAQAGANPVPDNFG